MPVSPISRIRFAFVSIFALLAVSVLVSSGEAQPGRPGGGPGGSGPGRPGGMGGSPGGFNGTPGRPNKSGPIPPQGGPGGNFGRPPGVGGFGGPPPGFGQPGGSPPQASVPGGIPLPTSPTPNPDANDSTPPEVNPPERSNEPRSYAPVTEDRPNEDASEGLNVIQVVGLVIGGVFLLAAVAALSVVVMSASATKPARLKRR